MAKETEAAPAPKSGLKSLILLIVVALVAGGGGFAVPIVLGKVKPEKAAEEAGEKNGKEAKTALVPFGDAVVNLAEDRLTRFLRLKLILVVDASQEKSMTELKEKKKAFLKSWLISYMSDRSLEEVKGAAGVNRMRREILDQFNAMLFPDGSDKIQDILFEEFVVQ